MPTNTAQHEIITIRYAVAPPTVLQILDLASWTPVLGPTANMFMIHAAIRYYNNPGTFIEELTVDQLGSMLGNLNPVKVRKTLHRLDRFDAIVLTNDVDVEINRWPRSA